MSDQNTTEVAEDAAPAAPSMADRLAEVCIELRSDLEVSRHVFRGVPHYVLRDPVSFGSHSFTLSDYRILTHLRGDRTLGETVEEMLADETLREEEIEHFYQFIFSLHKLGLLHLPISDEKTLYDRHLSRLKAKRAQLAKSLLFFRIPLVDPNAFLERTMTYVRPIFTKTAFALWFALVALASVVVLRNWAEFTEPVGNIFSNENLPLLWITLIGLKLFHELGHAYATKAFGGHVPEMGLFFMIFTPCAYVDASAAWGFSKKRERILVCMAGMYVELFIAALCLLAWSVMAPGLWRSVMHNAVMLASVITIGFNINPLMRYDGYYALSDAIEVPNLRARAQEEGTAILKRLLLGVRTQSRQISKSLRSFLVAFGIAGGIYKVTLVMGISATIAIQFPVIGLLMGGLYLLSEVYGILKRSIPYLWRSEETAPVRAKAMGLSVLMLGGLPAALMGIPAPHSVSTMAVLSGEEEIFLRANASGFVAALPLQEGQEVEEGQEVLRLEDPGALARLEEVRARLDAAKMALAHSRSLDPALAHKDELQVRQLEDEVASRQAELDRLAVVAPTPGILTQRIDADSLGKFVKRGEALATVVGGRSVVRALLTEEDIAATRPSPGQAVEFRSLASPDELVMGRVLHVAPAGRREFDQSFAQFLDPVDYSVNPATGMAARSLFEIEVEVDATQSNSSVVQGLRGKLRIPAAAEPLGARLLRKARTFLLRLTN